MHLIGRFERVRPLGPRGWGLPYILDRKWATLAPFAGEEWWRSPEGVWLPVIAGGIGFLGTRHRPRVALSDLNLGAVARATLALDSNYVAGTGGDAIAARIKLAAALTTTTLYFFINGFTGTAANVNDLNIEIRTGTATAPGTTAPDLVNSATFDPASTAGWSAVSLSQALSADTVYWLIVGDADGNITDFATVVRSVSGPGQLAYHDWIAATTTGGWASGNTLPATTAAWVVVFSDGSVFGNSHDASAGSTSSTNRRGWRLDGLTEQLKIFGAICASGSNNISGLEVFSGTAGPGDTPDATTAVEITGTTGVIEGYLFATPPTLAKSVVQRIVLTYSAAANQPQKHQITGANADLRAARLGGVNWYWAEANGTVDWSNDDTDAQPRMAVLVEDQVSVAAGGGVPRIIGDGS